MAVKYVWCIFRCSYAERRIQFLKFQSTVVLRWMLLHASIIWIKLSIFIKIIRPIHWSKLFNILNSISIHFVISNRLKLLSLVHYLNILFFNYYTVYLLADPFYSCKDLYCLKTLIFTFVSNCVILNFLHKTPTKNETNNVHSIYL